MYEVQVMHHHNSGGGGGGGVLEARGSLVGGAGVVTGIAGVDGACVTSQVV